MCVATSPGCDARVWFTLIDWTQPRRESHFRHQIARRECVRPRLDTTASTDALPATGQSQEANPSVTRSQRQHNPSNE